MRIRITLDILLFLGVFIAPLWLVVIIAVICLFIFESFYEIIFLGIIADGLFGLPIRFIAIPAVYTISASVLFIARSLLKKHLKFYV